MQIIALMYNLSIYEFSFLHKVPVHVQVADFDVLNGLRGSNNIYSTVLSFFIIIMVNSYKALRR